tara:strand:- start:1672 stop:2355 length:684 start_codon:yes stop_codon:yes gene_type:complete
MAKSIARLDAEERVLRERMVPRIAKAMGFSNADIDKLLVEFRNKGGFFEPKTNTVGLSKEGGYKYQRFVAAHELGHAKDYKLNPRKTKNYFFPNARHIKQNWSYKGISPDKIISRNTIPGAHGTDALRMETYANREAAKYLKSLGGKDVLGSKVKEQLLAQEKGAKSFLLGDIYDKDRSKGSRRMANIRHSAHTPYRYGVTMMKKAGLMGLLMALMIPAFAGGKKNA